jgi:hypothetical protein
MEGFQGTTMYFLRRRKPAIITPYRVHISITIFLDQ